jgi:hypothetical protein
MAIIPIPPSVPKRKIAKDIQSNECLLPITLDDSQVTQILENVEQVIENLEKQTEALIEKSEEALPIDYEYTGEMDQKSSKSVYMIKDIIDSVITEKGLTDICEIMDRLKVSQRQELKDLVEQEVTPDVLGQARDIIKRTHVDKKSMEEKKDKRGHRYCVNEQGRTKCPDNGSSTNDKKKPAQKEKENKNPKSNDPSESGEVAERIRKISAKLKISESIDLKQTDPDHPVAKQILEDKESHEIVKAMASYQSKYGDLFISAEQAEVDAKTALKSASTYLYFPLAKLDPTKKAAVLDYKAKQEKYNELNLKKQEAEKEIRKDLVLLMRPAKPIEISFVDARDNKYDDTDIPISDDLQQKANIGLNFVKMICAGDVNTKIGLLGTKQNRSFYRVLKEESANGVLEGSVVLTKNARVVTTIHELGHFLDNHKKGVREKALAFLEYRTNKEESIDMGSIADFLQGEQGKKDHFDRYFDNQISAYYVGKTYEQGDNEIVSMGLQALYEDPVKFCTVDPEYAQFIIGVLRDGDAEKVVTPKVNSSKIPNLQTKREHKGIAFYHQKSDPKNPQAGESYFANCERDESGHCLPKGEGNSNKTEKTNATKKEVPKSRNLPNNYQESDDVLKEDVSDDLNVSLRRVDEAIQGHVSKRTREPQEDSRILNALADRGVIPGREAFRGLAFDSKEKAQKYVNDLISKGYFSTSSEKPESFSSSNEIATQFAEILARQVMGRTKRNAYGVIIEVSPESKYAPLRGFSFNEYGEDECILPRGQTYEIIDMKEETDDNGFVTYRIYTKHKED